MKKRSILLMLLMLALFLVGCGANGGGESTETTTDETNTEEVDSADEETEEAPGERTAENKYGLDIDMITVATSPGYEPFEFMEGDELVGYDIDIWNEFEERTGITVEWEQADFSGLLGLLDTERADVIAAQMGPTPEREEKYAFTEPISYFGSIVAVHEDSDIEDPTSDLVDSTLGVGAGNEQQQTLQEFYEEGDIQWEIYNSGTLENMLSDIEFGRLDGTVGQNIQVSMAIDASGLPLKITKPFEESIGTLVVRKDATELLDAINAYIADIQADGTLSEISENWVGTDVSQSQN